jgi:hypothetical protein
VKHHIENDPLFRALYKTHIFDEECITGDSPYSFDRGDSLYARIDSVALIGLVPRYFDKCYTGFMVVVDVSRKAISSLCCDLLSPLRYRNVTITKSIPQKKMKRVDRIIR